MKKHILLISTFILSFILLAGNVNAATELTCTYPQGTFQDYVIMTQDKDGKRTYWHKKVGESEQELITIEVKEETLSIKNPKNGAYLSCAVTNILNGTTGKKNDDKLYQNCPEPSNGFDACPKCLNFKSKKAFYREDYVNSNSKTCSSGEVVLEKEEHKTITQSDIDSLKILPADTAKKEDLEKYNQCKYGNTGSMVFYISTDQTRMYSNIISSTSQKGVYLTDTIKFTKSEFLKEYNKGTCPSVIYSACENDPNGLNSKCEWFITAKKDTADVEVRRYFLHEDVDVSEDPDNPKVTIHTCEELFGNKTIEEIKKIMGIIKAVVPILLIIFGITDFFRATFSSKEEDMKKDRDRFIKRIIAAIVVFLVPTFVSLVLTLANSVWSDTITKDMCIESTNQ